MTSRRVGGVIAVVAGASLYGPAAPAQPSNAELARLVRQQVARIKQLKQRLDALEKQRGGERQTRGAVPNNRSAAGPNPNAAQASTRERQKPTHTRKPHRITADWRSGAPKFSSPNGVFTFEPLGRVQYDISKTTGSDFHSNSPGVDHSRNITASEFRRVRLGVKGRLTKPFSYEVQLDFAGGDVSLRNVYLAGKKNFALGQGVIYLGNKHADRGLNGYTSSKYIWFVDRNAVTETISPTSGSYSAGATAFFYGKYNWHLSAAVYGSPIDGANDSSDNLSLLSRGHYDLIATDNADLHVGAYGFYDDFNNDRTATFSDSYHIAAHSNDNVQIASGNIAEPATGTGWVGELGGLLGPFAASAEYGQRTIHTHAGGDADIRAYTGQVGYSITGEKFGYSTKKGTWNRPNVARPVTQGGPGAWQIMVRYQALDYEDNARYAGGHGHGETLGLSWYLNDYFRALLDYTRWRTKNRIPTGPYYGADDGNTISARVQVVF